VPKARYIYGVFDECRAEHASGMTAGSPPFVLEARLRHDGPSARSGEDDEAWTPALEIGAVDRPRPAAVWRLPGMWVKIVYL
jgi:hypothetical protein